MKTHYTLFISDLHLQADEPEIADILLKFLREDAPQADALYILGDLFEAWIGDDDCTPFNDKITAALKETTQTGLPVYFMRGNRDFLIGEKFAEKTGVRLIQDPTVIDLYGEKILLMHGDSLCVFDRLHQFWRKITLNSLTQKWVLILPLQWRRKIGEWLRKKSQMRVTQLKEYVMDAPPEEAERMLQLHAASRLIHGHTHRPEIAARRAVLGAWHKAGSVLRCDAQGRWEITTLTLKHASHQ